MTHLNHKDQHINNLEIILQATEPDEQLEKTLVQLGEVSQEIAKECANPFNRLHYRDEKGFLFYLNYQEGSPLHVNGKDALYYEQAYSIFEKAGKQLLRSLVGQDGAIELSNDGRIKSARRKLKADDYDAVAAQKGVIKEGEEVSPVQLGYDVKARKKKPFSKHMGGMTASGIDSKAYLIVQSSTGDWVLLHDYKIVFSTIESEIHPAYRKYLTSFTQTEHPSPGKSKPTTNDSVYSKPMSPDEELFLSFKIRQEAMSTLRHSSHGSY